MPRPSTTAASRSEHETGSIWTAGLRTGPDLPGALDTNKVRYGLGVARLHRNGFVSLDVGPVRGGKVVTKAVHRGGRQLQLNAACGQSGFIRVEVTDRDGNATEGFGRGKRDTFTGDSTDMTIAWQGQPDVPHSGAVRQRFYVDGCVALLADAEVDRQGSQRAWRSQSS